MGKSDSNAGGMSSVLQEVVPAGGRSVVGSDKGVEKGLFFC